MKPLEQNLVKNKRAWTAASSTFLLDFCTIESSGKLNFFHLVVQLSSGLVKSYESPVKGKGQNKRNIG